MKCKYQRITNSEIECCRCTFNRSHYNSFDYNRICKQWLEENYGFEYNVIFAEAKALALHTCMIGTDYHSIEDFLRSEDRMKLAFETFKEIFIESIMRIKNITV